MYSMSLPAHHEYGSQAHRYPDPQSLHNQILQQSSLPVWNWAHLKHKLAKSKYRKKKKGRKKERKNCGAGARKLALEIRTRRIYRPWIKVSRVRFFIWYLVRVYNVSVNKSSLHLSSSDSIQRRVPSWLASPCRTILPRCCISNVVERVHLRSFNLPLRVLCPTSTSS